VKKETITEVRADTYLWAIRMFKSRTIAGEAIKGGKVKLNETNVKASHAVKVGEIYTISLGEGLKKIIEVSALTDKRKNFETAKQHYIDHSPPLEKLSKEDKAFFTTNVKHEKGSGRPTKKDRRNLKEKGGWF